jgi:hypothetical protein
MIEIVGWDKNYENNRTRDMVKMQWVPIPNRLDGDGYTELVSHPNGPAHFGAWCALLAVASRCGKRGTLLRDGGQPHDEASLERITRIPAETWRAALPRLVTIGWITGYEIPQEGAEIPHLSRTQLTKNGRKEEKERKEGKEHSTAVAEASDPRYPDFFAKVKSAFESKNAEMDYKREGPAIKWIVEHALTRDDPEGFLRSMLNLFWKLTHDQREKIWYQQPFIPSVMRSGGLWPRLLTKLQESAEDSEAAAKVGELTKGWWT